MRKTDVVFISERAAKLHFPGKEAYGQIIKDNIGHDYQVVGVYKDLPTTSHFKADFLISYATAIKRSPVYDRGGEINYVYFYLKLRPNCKPDDLISAFNNKYIPKNSDLRKNAQIPFLRPLLDIHLKSDVLSELLLDTGNYFLIMMLLLVAIIILITAWINFINLSTSKSIERSRETGIRKVNGATKAQLIFQFLTESMIINFIAGGLTFVLLIFVLPVFSTYLNLYLPLQFWKSSFFWMLFGGLIIGGGVISGLIPAWIQANFKPTDVLKGGLIKHSGGFRLRKILLTVQFVASITLITCTLIVYLQINYLQSLDKGFDRKNIIAIKPPNSQIDEAKSEIQHNMFIAELQKIPGVLSASASEVIPGEAIPQRMSSFQRADVPMEEGHRFFAYTNIDENFFKTFGIQLLAGQNFTSEKTVSPRKIILNVSGIKALGFKTPTEAVGQILISRNKSQHQILGVVNDYSQSWSGKEHEPIWFEYGYFWFGTGGQYSIRFDEKADKEAIISKVNTLWRKLFPDYPFEYITVDDAYNLQYTSLFRFNRCFILFSLLAIFISGMGLIGYCNYSTILKRKEIALRKTMGASNFLIMLVLYKDYIKTFILSAVIGIITSEYFKDLLLKNYPNKVTISPSFYFIPLFVVLVLILLTVSYQVVKASMEPPLKALQYE
jgi:putative ABC transport system permease protein